MSNRKPGDHGSEPQRKRCARCGRSDEVELDDCTLDRKHRITLCRECFDRFRFDRVVGRFDRIAAHIPGIGGTEPKPQPTMSEKELRMETRKQKALDRLGTDHPICAGCLGDDWRYMELHHLEGQAFGETLVIVCGNCHCILTDGQKDHPEPLGEPSPTDERFGRYLVNQADLSVLIAGKLKEIGEYLIERARAAMAGHEPSEP